eukprot:scaffold7213_cov166-Amphora_coffeaeformis.AAC.17
MYRVASTTLNTTCSGCASRRLALTTTKTTTRRWFTTVDKKTTVTTTSPAKASPSGSTSGPMEFKNAAERHEYLKAANAEMERYHHARELLRQGKLKSKTTVATAGRPSESSSYNTGMAQLGVVTLFLVAFMATPLVGKKIAKDEEFRNKWVPSWYDFTVAKPENPWTREELHEQMIAVQREIRERAIRGEFSAEKLEELQKNLEGQYTTHRATMPQSAIRKEWERIHPGLEEGEDVNEGS